MRNFLIAVVVMSAGCSPYAYGPEINKFADATKSFSDSLTAAQIDIREEPARRAFWTAYANPSAGVSFSEVSCKANSARACHVRINGTAYALTPADIALIKAIEPLKALGGYANGLKAVTNAKDRANLDAASATLRSSVTSFVSSTVPAPGAAQLAELTVHAGTSVSGLFLDQARLSQLKNSVQLVQSEMPAVEPKLAGALIAIRNRRISELRIRMGVIDEPLRTGKPAFSHAERLTLMRELQALASQVSALQRSKPDILAKKMAAAHKALADALANPKVNLVEVTKSIGEFARLVADFKTAFDNS